MRNLYLYLVVFVAGAAVLAIELLGTRILGPNQGLTKSADGSKANKICITGSTKRTPISWLNHPVPDF